MARPNQTQRNRLEQLCDARGGAYRSSGANGVFFHIFTNATFLRVDATRRAIAVTLLVDTPPGAARAPDSHSRAEFWMHGKRLQVGTLVALVRVGTGGGVIEVFPGVVSMPAEDQLGVVDSCRKNSQKIVVPIAFFDAEPELLALRRHGQRGSRDKQEPQSFLVDFGIMYEASRPFLERLKRIEPMNIPFARYLVSGGTLADVDVPPPAYALAPRFRYRLEGLAKDSWGAINIHSLDVTRPTSATTSRNELVKHSTLDPSQVDAVVSSLTREIALIQGSVDCFIL